MGGGSYLYAYRRVEEFAEALERNERLDGDPLCEPNDLVRLAFADHLRKVAAAMQAVEWVDSGDCSPPHDRDAICEVINSSPLRGDSSPLGAKGQESTHP